jgi:hypothetical protein
MADGSRVLRTLLRENLEARAPAKRAFEHLNAHLSAPNTGEMERVLRDHRRKGAGVKLRKELDLRQGYDELVELYMLLEVALRCRVLSVDDAPAFFERCQAQLNQPQFLAYYTQHYPEPLAQALRLRLTNGADGSTAAPWEFERFLATVDTFRSDPDILALRWILDDGSWSDGSNLHTVLDLLLDCDAARAALSDESPSQGERALRGIFEISAFCDRQLELLAHAQTNAQLSAWLWHYHGYWYERLRRHEGTLLEGVNRALSRWGEGNAPATEFGRNLRKVLDPKWGAPLLRYIASLDALNHEHRAFEPHELVTTLTSEGDARRHPADVLEDLAAAFMKTHPSSLALDYLKNALELRVSMFGNASEEVVRTRWLLVSAQLRGGDPECAIEELTQVFATLQSAGWTDATQQELAAQALHDIAESESNAQSYLTCVEEQGSALLAVRLPENLWSALAHAQAVIAAQRVTLETRLMQRQGSSDDND